MLKASGKKAPTPVIQVRSEKGGTHTQKVTLKK
jgi:hypothetical protein